jgi:hypothetical protein
MAGMPFSHTWVWLYVLPPGVLAWLVTRPVLEGKRLPELVLSQLRYLSEPRTWCRMAPLAEQDEVTVFAKVWRRTATLALPDAVGAQAVGAEAVVEAAAVEDAIEVPVRPVWPSSPAIHAPAAAYAVPRPAPERPVPEHPAPEHPAPERPAPKRPAPEGHAPKPPWQPAAPTATAARAGFTVRTDGPTAQPLHVVERALRTSPGGSGASGWRDRVVVVPGGHRPGKPDQVQRDQARARLPLAGPARIVVLGCTAGAGQTVTTLLTGHLLAGLRGEPVAVLGLSSGAGSLTEQARQIPRLLPGRRTAAQIAPSDEEPRPGRERGLQVVTADTDADEPDAGKLIDAVVARYPLTLADPAAVQVPRALHVADQLVLVAPANADAAGALAMTLEWLDGNGHAELARRAIAVLNGVSVNTTAQTDKAAAVATGRCRAIVRMPWDDGLAGAGALGVAAVQAYTALAGVLVSGLADPAASSAGQSGRAQSRSAGQ